MSSSDESPATEPRRLVRTLSDVFDPRINALNAVRLVLALGVIFFHSHLLIGSQVEPAPLRQFLEKGFVDSFFAISGFLITRSWIERPVLLTYLRARALRILPAFWVCLAVTALVFAPLTVLLRGGDVAALLRSTSPYGYIVSNMFVYLDRWDIAGAPTTAYGWNDSLWTLFWEILCYLAVAGFGVAGLLRRRWAIAAAAVTVWLLALLAVTETLPFDKVAAAAIRFGLMFLAGALIYRYSRRIPVHWALTCMSAVVVVAAMWLPDYRLVGAPLIAYFVISLGVLVKTPRLTLRTDLSYGTYIYGMPVQHLLVAAGLSGLAVPAFTLAAAICTLPVAAASWFLVEHPLLRWNRRGNTTRVGARVRG